MSARSSCQATISCSSSRRSAAGRARVHRHGQADDEVVAAGLADAAQQRGREAHAVLERATPAVGPTVGPRRPELVDDRVVRGEQLDAVEAGPLRPYGGPHEAVEQLLDLALGHGVAAVGVVVRGQPRRRPARGEGVVGVAVLADVVQLLDHRHVGGLVAGLCDAAEVGDERVVVDQEVAPGQHAGGVGGDGLDDDHRRAAERPLAVVGEVAVAGSPTLGHVRGVGAERDPRCQRPVPEGERREDVGERSLGGHRRPARRQSRSAVMRSR